MHIVTREHRITLDAVFVDPMKNSVVEHLMESYSDVADTAEPPSSDSMKNEEKNTERKG